MRRFRIDRLGGVLLAGAMLCASLVCSAQVDTVEVRIWGGQQDDRGVRLISLQNGEVLSLSSTNSTSNDQPQAWVQRLDGDAQPIWETTLNDEPLLQPVDAVEHEDGRITVLSMRYANAAEGYDWQWHTLDPNGSVVSSQTWGTAAWDLPQRCFDREGELWSVGTTYISGAGDTQWTRHTWMGNSWALSDASSFGFDEEDNISGAYTDLNTLGWNWPAIFGGGYHFLRLEGEYLDSNNTSAEFKTHMGTASDGSTMPRTNEINHFDVILPNSNLTVSSDFSFDIEMNIEEWYTNPIDWDFNVWNAPVMPISAAQKALNSNGSSVFTFKKQ